MCNTSHAPKTCLSGTQCQHPSSVAHDIEEPEKTVCRVIFAMPNFVVILLFLNGGAII